MWDSICIYYLLVLFWHRFSSRISFLLCEFSEIQRNKLVICRVLKTTYMIIYIWESFQSNSKITILSVEKYLSLTVFDEVLQNKWKLEEGDVSGYLRSYSWFFISFIQNKIVFLEAIAKTKRKKCVSSTLFFHKKNVIRILLILNKNLKQKKEKLFFKHRL